MSDLPYSLQQDLFDRKNKAMAFVQQGASTDPQTLTRLLGIANTWPSMKPGAIISLAQSGYDRLSPETRKVAQLSTQQDMNQQAWHAALPTDLHANVKNLTAPTQGASSLAGMNTGQLVDLYQTFHSDVKQVDNNKISADDFKKKWNVDPNYDAEGMKRTEDALTYALGKQDQGSVKHLFQQKGLDFKGYNQYLPQVKEESSIAQDMKSVSQSLPMEAIKGVTREAGALANVGLQGLQGSIRNVAGGGNPLFSASGATVGQQTDVGQQYQNLLSGGDTSLGNGFLPSPESAPAQQALAVQKAAAPTIGGHAFTLGRGIASHVFEPDTDAFNVLSGVVDAPVAYYGDPASKIIGTLGDLRQEAKTFSPETVNTIANTTGLVPTTSRIFQVGPTKANYLAGPQFEQDINKIAAKAGPEINTSSVYRAVAAKNPNFPITTVHGQPILEDLTNALRTGDTNAARDAVARATEVGGPLQPPGVTYNLTKSTPPRMLATMPTGTFPDLTDKKAVWTVLDDTMKSANVPVIERDAALHTMITDPNPMAGITASQNAIEKSLVAYGHDPVASKSMASFFQNAHTTSRLYDVDQATQLERVRPGIGIAGEAVPIPAPSLSSEGLNGGLTIPDPRTLRRAASDFSYLTSTKPWKVSQTALNYPATLWKPLQVLTARMAVKIFGETQTNLAARGMINAFTHPLQFASALIGTNYDTRLGTMLEKIPGLDAKYLLGPDGYGVVTDGDNLLMHTATFLHDPETIATKGYMAVPINHPEAGVGLAEQLGRMHADPIMKGIAEQPNPQAAKDWFWGEAAQAPGTYTPEQITEQARKRLASSERMLGEHAAQATSAEKEIATHLDEADRAQAAIAQAGEGGAARDQAYAAARTAGYEDPVAWAEDAEFKARMANGPRAGQQAGQTRDFADLQRQVANDRRILAEHEAGNFTNAGVPVHTAGPHPDQTGKALRLARAPFTASNDEHYMQQLASGKLTSFEPVGDIANSRLAADNYVDKVMFPRLNDMTGGGNSELMDAVRTGQLNGRTIYNVQRGRPDLNIVDQRAAAYAKSLLDQGIGPKNVVPIRETVSRASTEGARAAHYARTAEDALFHGLVDVPDAVMNRKVAWSQLLWKHSIDNAPYLSAEDLATLKETALESGLSKAQSRALDAVKTAVSPADTGIPIYRHTGEPLETSLARPTGAHFGFDATTWPKGSGQTLEMRLEPKNPLHVSSPEKFDSAGHLAAQQLLPQNQWQEIDHILYDQQDIPGGLQWAADHGVHFDAKQQAFLAQQPPGSVMDAIGGQLAKNAGHDVVIKQGGPTAEAMVLNKSAVHAPVAPMERLTIPQLTKLSKLNAVDDMKGIVHDLTTRSQSLDMVRFMVPFGDAFRLVATRLAKLVNDEPQVLRRFQQGVQEAQSPGSSTVNQLLGDPVPPGQGFFHTDSYGEEVFTAPGSTLLDQSLLGVPIPLQGQVSGLSMIGEGYPGLGGPSLTLPAKWLLPDTPVGNQIRDVIFPMGGGDSQGLGADIGGAFVPSWMNKMINGPADQKTMASTTLSVMRTLYSQGGYDNKNPADMARLANDAKHDAKWLYFIRGAAQFVSPGAPTPDFQVQDKTGNLAEAQVIVDKYHQLQGTEGSDKALQWVLTNFGTKNIFLTQGASQANSYALPTSKEAQVWVDKNPGIANKYPLTYGLFAPQGGGTFDQAAYNEQFTKGERRTLSPQEQIAQAENRLGFLAYNHRRQQILDGNNGGNLTRPQTAWLRDYRTYLEGQFPGFDSYLASPYDSVKRRAAAVTELQAAANDPSVRNTDAGQGLVQYLSLRDKAIAAAKQKGLASPFQAKSARQNREYLRDGAQWVVQNHPEFRPIYEQIFSHEMVADPTQTGGG